MRIVIRLIAFATLCSGLVACGSAAKKESPKNSPAPTATATPTPTPTPPPNPPAAQTPTTSSETSSMKCTNGSDVRGLEVEVTRSKGCKLQYKKWGQRQEIASSAVGRKHCDDVLERVKKNLSDAHFDCH